MKLPRKTLEKKIFADGYRLIYAIDEVGMGCLAGPVVVCAVAFEKKFFNLRHKKLQGLRDSKLLSAHQREEYARELFQVPGFKFQVCYAYPRTIDKLNIYNATRMAMKRAILKLSNSKSEFRNPKQNSKIRNSKSKIVWNFGNSNLDIVSEAIPVEVPPREPSPLNLVFRASDLKSIVLVDGKTKIKGLKMDQIPIVKGDRKVFAIACASIIAKVHRDKMMMRYAKKYPGYGLEKHKGYGTKYHQVRLTFLGPCEIHRRSFAPVAKLI
ncbi:MAG: ribonuclease HII [Candidatus Yanofskybacteria bacterium RIFCSPHIGHO2_01_FULL_39_8b]|uniref:Ribonuclease n=1 Tax=Candidatus Yanofskybacteria bacterium RIFCSPHIGHO2_01_FULL_39_8b TaxID=1802659 RepID=A0A1F8E9W9_9BACT|nr:MAG: ribonuclease HII [Candidatus Yanofskybacteria bacterium RIFCSPHIGHO2_01_FULL_39_8b]